MVNIKTCKQDFNSLFWLLDEPDYWFVFELSVICRATAVKHYLNLMIDLEKKHLKSACDCNCAVLRHLLLGDLVRYSFQRHIAA